MAVFRSDMILAHTRYRGQLNVADIFTRLIFSLLVTGIAPHSFYESDGVGCRARAHYDGLPVDFIAAAVTMIGTRVTAGYRSFDVMNPHDDGVSLDVFVDWLIQAGNNIRRINDYDEWLSRFQTALRVCPNHSVSTPYRLYCMPSASRTSRSAARPHQPTRSYAEVLAVRAGPDKDIRTSGGAHRQVRQRPDAAQPTGAEYARTGLAALFGDQPSEQQGEE